MDKEKYITPDMDIVKFEAEDIVTASGDGVNGVDDDETAFMPISK